MRSAHTHLISADFYLSLTFSGRRTADVDVPIHCDTQTAAGQPARDVLTNCSNSLSRNTVSTTAANWGGSDGSTANAVSSRLQETATSTTWCWAAYFLQRSLAVHNFRVWAKDPRTYKWYEFARGLRGSVLSRLVGDRVINRERPRPAAIEVP